MLLKNKKVVISAGASGIGWATAKVLHKEEQKYFYVILINSVLKKLIKIKKIIYVLSYATLTMRKMLEIFLKK